MGDALRLLVPCATIRDGLTVIAFILLVALELLSFIETWRKWVLSGLKSVVNWGLEVLVFLKFVLFNS